MKHKVKDEVTIKTNLKEYKYYGSWGFISSMMKFKGKKAKIIKVNESGYEIDIDKGMHTWTDGMFEDNSKSQSAKKTIEHIISGNKTIVIIHNEDGSYKKGIALCSPEDKFDENIGFKLAYDRAMGVKEDKDNVNLQKIDSELIILQRMCLDCCYSSTIFDNLNTLKTISDLGKRISKLRYEIKKYI